MIKFRFATDDFDPDDFAQDLVREAIEETVQETLVEALGKKDAGKITVIITGKSLTDYSVTFEGESDLVQKAEDAFADNEEATEQG